MYGFRGHFASKSRRYSITLGALRRARRRAQALRVHAEQTDSPLDLAAREAELLADHDDSETTLVIGSWQYAGTGWANDTERTLALAAAARAREYNRQLAQLRKAPNYPERTEQ
jgi:glycine/D-amino acid oxidase-like deaminating enzyme